MSLRAQFSAEPGPDVVLPERIGALFDTMRERGQVAACRRGQHR
jgi:hypothetical protein